MRQQRRGNRGILLISSYFLLTIFLVYSNVLTMRAISQRMAADTLRDGDRARGLARAALEQLSEEIYAFLTGRVWQDSLGQADVALRWLEQLGQGGEVPPFDLQDQDGDGLNEAKQDDDEGSAMRPLCVRNLATVPPAGPHQVTTLPTCYATTELASKSTVIAPRAWIVSVAKDGLDLDGDGVIDPSNAFSPRVVTLEGEAEAGGVAKRVRAAYVYRLAMSDIFRYAYFVNNYGWFNPPANSNWKVNGEIRANSDLAFGSRAVAELKVQGDLYASVNPALRAAGDISGFPGYLTQTTDYWTQKPGTARPTRQLSLTGQPAIGGSATILAYGRGWNTEGTGFPVPQEFERQKTQDIPYLGDLGLYKGMADAANSSIKRGGTTIVSEVYTGSTPLVLVGTRSQPLVLDGPVVATGDVIIKGYVTGRGTIYAGRNVHIIGEITYVKPFTVAPIERNALSGQIRLKSAMLTLGTVCNGGQYLPPGGGSCP